MKLKKILATKNNCYISGKKHTVKGIMVHSTGANNPELRRYVAPDDGTIGKNQCNNDFNRPKPGGIEICPHAWIGKLADGSIATVQTLPWDMVGWHSGSGSLGFAKNANNNGYIGFEICEDNLTNKAYFDKVYKESVELCAYLCKQYNLNPKTAIICHSEGHKLGVASNHGDVMHWFPKHGKSMDSLRADVTAMINKPVSPPKPTPTKQYEITATKTITGDPNSVVAKLKADGYKVTVKEVGAKTGATTSAQPKLKSIDVIAREVINGAWGNGADRKKRLTDAGYDYAKVQAKVNELV